MGHLRFMASFLTILADRLAEIARLNDADQIRHELEKLIRTLRD